MTIFQYKNGNIVTAAGTVSNAKIAVENGRIAILDTLDEQSAAIDLQGGWVVPGFIDVQVNGGGGILFNDTITPDGIAAIGAAHAQFGTTAFLPTLISDTADKVEEALDAVDAAIEGGVRGVLGIHIEGPVLNPLRKGIHEENRLRILDADFLALLTRPRKGKVIVTLAPEQVAAEDIAAMVAAGVIVSCGHSEASYEQATAAFNDGATGITHLFNAMPPMQARAPGLAGAALDDQRIWCGVIVDGHHVSNPMLRLALRSKTVDRMMLVTDAMPSVGAVHKDFVLQGKQIAVVDGRCSYSDNTLAGSDLDMAAAVKNAVAMMGVTVEQASIMASQSPAAFLGLGHERGSIAVGMQADWVRLDAALNPIETVMGGQPS